MESSAISPPVLINASETRFVPVGSCTDSAASRYFAHLCWENSFFPTARAVDKAFKPDPGRALIARPFSAMADESYDRLFNDDTWWVSSLVVQYKPRPDLQAWAAAMPVG